MKYCVCGISTVVEGYTPKIVLSLRNMETKERTMVRVPYNPYFYCLESSNQVISDVLRDSNSNNVVVSKEYGFMGTDGNKLVKVTVALSEHIKEVNRNYALRDSLYESNVKHAHRFIIDKKITTGVDENVNPVDVENINRLWFIDVEFLQSKGKIDYNAQLIIIGVYDVYENKYYSLFVDDKKSTVNQFTFDSIILSNPKDVEVISCSSEVDLLERFCGLWLKLKPDNVISFSDLDMRYIVKRMKKNGIDVNCLSPIFNVDVKRNNDEEKERLTIECVDVLDFALLYRKVFGEPVWNTLDFISVKELGYGKVELKDIVEDWKTDPVKVIQYNIRDVELLKELEVKLELIKKYVGLIWKYTGLSFSDCLIPNKMADMLYLRHLNGKVIFPSTSRVPKKNYKGALVLCNRQGLHGNVGVLDWNELYPSIMETFHISLDTLDLYGDIVIDKEEDMIFTSKEPGWANEIIISLRNERSKIKMLAKTTVDKHEKRVMKIMSSAVKVLSNAVYGMFGQKTDTYTSRFYDYRVAGAITYIGRVVLVEANRFLKEIGYNLLYGDTDSLFVKLKENTLEELNNLKVSLEKHIKDFIKVKYGIESKLRLDYEHIFHRVLILTKKRYHGITTDGETIVKGLEYVRKDTANITVEQEKIVGSMRLNGEHVDNIRLYIKNMALRVKRGIVPLDDIAVKGMCTKDTYARVNRNDKAVKWSRHLGIHKFNVNERFYWLYIKPKQTMKLIGDGKLKDVPMDVVAFKNLSEIEAYNVKQPTKDTTIEVDLERMSEYVVTNPLSQYVDVPDTIIKQSTLF